MTRVQRIPMDSSMISAVGYDADEKTLYLEFVNTGYVYAYYDVPQEVFENLRKSRSAGSFVRNEILDFYTGFRVRQGRHFRW